jgi:hypothetical protein
VLLARHVLACRPQLRAGQEPPALRLWTDPCANSSQVIACALLKFAASATWVGRLVWFKSHGQPPPNFSFKPTPLRGAA